MSFIKIYVASKRLIPRMLHCYCAGCSFLPPMCRKRPTDLTAFFTPRSLGELPATSAAAFSSASSAGFSKGATTIRRGTSGTGGISGGVSTSRITIPFTLGTGGFAGSGGGAGTSTAGDAGDAEELASQGAAFKRAFAHKSGPKRQMRNPSRATQTITGTPAFLKLRGMNPCALPNISIAANRKTAPSS